MLLRDFTHRRGTPCCLLLSSNVMGRPNQPRVLEKAGGLREGLVPDADAIGVQPIGHGDINAFAGIPHGPLPEEGSLALAAAAEAAADGVVGRRVVRFALVDARITAV